MAEQQIPPEFGVDRMADYKSPPAPEVKKPEYLTPGEGTWYWSAPPWDPSRVREGRFGPTPVPVKVHQRVEDPRDKKKKNPRVSIQTIRSWKNQDGTSEEVRFWINPGPYGFDGMPKPKKVQQVEPEPTLGL